MKTAEMLNFFDDISTVWSHLTMKPVQSFSTSHPSFWYEFLLTTVDNLTCFPRENKALERMTHEKLLLWGKGILEYAEWENVAGRGRFKCCLFTHKVYLIVEITHLKMITKTKE